MDAFLGAVNERARELPAAPEQGASLVDAMRRTWNYAAIPCLRCNAPARWPAIAETDAGVRWVDLCWGCSRWLLLGATGRIEAEIATMTALNTQRNKETGEGS